MKIDVLGYYVYDSGRCEWLAPDNTWTSLFSEARECHTAQEANGAMQKHGGDYVFACMPSEG